MGGLRGGGGAAREEAAVDVRRRAELGNKLPRSGARSREQVRRAGVLVAGSVQGQLAGRTAGRSGSVGLAQDWSALKGELCLAVQ